MPTYKFWKTQPVAQFNEIQVSDREYGPISSIDSLNISQEPLPLVDGYEWVSLDISNEVDLQNLYELLKENYVEDEDEDFRCHYSPALLRWALTPPGWKPEWHVGIRESKSSLLVASITAVPMIVQIHKKELKVASVNFLCLSTDLRHKRVAPVLIQEIQRRCYRDGVYQAIYTSGSVLPTPISSPRQYFHRTLNLTKACETGFKDVASGSTFEEEEARLALPENTVIPNLRPMMVSDVPRIQELLKKYLGRFDLAPIIGLNGVCHWFMPETKTGESQAVYTYVVEDPKSSMITDVISFFVLASTVLRVSKHRELREAYLSYYATEYASMGDRALKERLKLLIGDGLVLAKRVGCDVFSAIEIADNPLYLSELQFDPGTGYLHFYLFNYKTMLVQEDVDSTGSSGNSMSGGVFLVLP